MLQPLINQAERAGLRKTDHSGRQPERRYFIRDRGSRQEGIAIVTFIVSLVVLLSGYFILGKYYDRTFGVDESSVTPAIRLRDNIDYLPLPEWKIFMIQFLNIAGLGPIFGAILGATFGPVVFLWIVFGCLFIGGAHDYFSGMISLRNDGKSIPEMVGEYFGTGMKNFLMIFSMILLVLVGVVFVTGPAKILADLFGTGSTVWLYVIFAYYVAATLFPIDQIIGRIYPFFAIVLLIMALGLAGYMLTHQAVIPELSVPNLANLHDNAQSSPIFPILFITLACGAVSGFHSTQSPMMARCMTNESQGKRVFFGAMVAESVIALIWAAAAMCFFGGVSNLNAEMLARKNDAALVVNMICKTWLGQVGGALAILGVVACPITTGDTAFRSARLTIADFLGLDQKPIKNRLLISVPLFVIAYVLTFIDFAVIWRYFGWCNQTIAIIMLFTASIFLIRNGKNHWFITIPGVFMTFVCFTYIMIAREGLGLRYNISTAIGAAAALFVFTLFMKFARKSSCPPAEKVCDVE